MTNDEVSDWLYRIRSKAEVFMSEAQNAKAKEAVATAIEALEKQKTGRWILTGTADCDGNNNYICSNCKRGDAHAKGQKVPFCWWCGARMEEENDTRESR